MTQDDRIEGRKNKEQTERMGTEKTERSDAGFNVSADDALLADYRLPNPFFFGIGG